MVEENKKLIFIAGPCVMEDEYNTLAIASSLRDITLKYPVEWIFKASFDKANRTSLNSYRGVGIEEGKRIFKNLKSYYDCKILTDIHSVNQALYLSNVVDVMQIPAFLCRQTDLVLALAKTGKTVNIKKGQFLAPEDVYYIIEKIESTGNKNIMITERGTCFGYHNLVVDFRSFLIMAKSGYPVIYDACHSQQLPSIGCQTKGHKEFIIPMAKAAVACGVDGIFVEVHPNPDKAKCDKDTVLNLEEVEQLLKEIT